MYYEDMRRDGVIDEREIVSKVSRGMCWSLPCLRKRPEYFVVPGSYIRMSPSVSHPFPSLSLSPMMMMILVFRVCCRFVSHITSLVKSRRESYWSSWLKQRWTAARIDTVTNDVSVAKNESWEWILFRSRLRDHRDCWFSSSVFVMYYSWRRSLFLPVSIVDWDRRMWGCVTRRKSWDNKKFPLSQCDGEWLSCLQNIIKHGSVAQLCQAIIVS
jgi:hypothetical protein